MKSLVIRLYSGIFRCDDCETEFALFRVKSLLCPECKGRLYRVLTEFEDEPMQGNTSEAGELSQENIT